jgi:hypothetical protein
MGSFSYLCSLSHSLNLIVNIQASLSLILAQFEHWDTLQNVQSFSLREHAQTLYSLSVVSIKGRTYQQCLPQFSDHPVVLPVTRPLGRVFLAEP